MAAVVVTLGSHTISGGLAQNFLSPDQPSVIASTWVSESRKSDQQASTDGATMPASIQAVRSGQVINWDALERILYDILYSKLGWELGSEGTIVIAEPICTPRDVRERMAQLAFEVFNVEGLFFADEPVLALYSVGKSSGLVVDIGHDTTGVALVVEGQLYLPSLQSLPSGGRLAAQYLAQLLAAKDEPIELTGAEAQAVFEACCRTEEAGDSKQGSEQSFTLPNGRTVRIAGSDAAKAAACLLQPAMMGVAGPSVVEAAAASVFTHLEPAVRKTALDCVMVCGGGSCCPGIAQKLCRQLRGMLPPSTPPCVAVVPEYMPQDSGSAHAAWIGGGLLSKVLTQHSHYITRGEYDGMGPPVVHRKVGL